MAKELVPTKTLKNLVQDWFEDETCKTELQGSLPESVGLKKEESHHSHANKKSKTKDQSSKKTEKRLEDQASLEDKSKYSVLVYAVDEKGTTRYK